MKQRSVAKVIIFSFITFGIYTLFWLRDTRKELLASNVKILPVKVLMLPYVALIAVSLLQFVVHFVAGSSTTVLEASSPASTISNLLSVLVGLIAVVVVLPLAIFWFYRYCKAAEIASNGQVSLGFSFGLLVLFAVLGLQFVWPGIMQSKYNELSPAAQPTFPTV